MYGLPPFIGLKHKNNSCVVIPSSVLVIGFVSENWSNPKKNIGKWVPLCCTIDIDFHGCVKFVFNVIYHCIRKTIMSEDGLSAS